MSLKLKILHSIFLVVKVWFDNLGVQFYLQKQDARSQPTEDTEKSGGSTPLLGGGLLSH